MSLTDKTATGSGNQYDYIVAGGGCAGLSFLVRVIRSGKFSQKKILLVDSVRKEANDRTWCFWERDPGLFEEVVHKKWETVWFNTDSWTRKMELLPYEYKMIRGVDFYRYCYALIDQQPNIEQLFAPVEKMVSNTEESFIISSGQKIRASYIFNSLPLPRPTPRKNEYCLLQHFKGWVIETAGDCFNPAEATLMDFRTSQDQGCTFVYVMPFSPTKALVEYTLFSEKLLEQSQYDQGLKTYLDDILQVKDYRIQEEEFGVIPMTNHRFMPFQHHVIHMGGAGGQTKPSSGYTFQFIQKHAEKLVESLSTDGHPFLKKADFPGRFRFYDSVLLNILHHGSLPGKKIFEDLFKKSKPQHLLRFLDNESSLGEELRIIGSLPILPFLKAATRQL